VSRSQAGSFPLAAAAAPTRVAGFRTKLLVAMMLVVSAITLLALYFAQRSLAANVEVDLQREFRADFAALQRAREIRHAALVERCRALVRKPRIQEATEDYAQDLLYPNAKDELADIMQSSDAPVEETAHAMRAQFYRFLDRKGGVIPPPNPIVVGPLSASEEAQLALNASPQRQQIGYVARSTKAHPGMISEVLAMPIISTDTGQAIASLALGFEPFELNVGAATSGMQSGIWLGDRLHWTSPGAVSVAVQAADIKRALDSPVRVMLGEIPWLLFAKHLNPGSMFPPAFEVCVYPLSNLLVRQRQLRWQVLGAGALLLLLGLAASHVASGRLSRPVERLVVDSERSARFSADASHQLKTPVTVMRAGLEELLANENLTPEECHQISALIHQTYRLSSLIEDLLLLSRLDAGRLKLDFSAVNLSNLIEAAIDDLSALPDELEVEVETDFPSGLHIAGEKRYTTIILQNLLENARKYNRRGGRIRIAAVTEGEVVRLIIGNTGRPISPATQENIFERFHRGTIGENVPGYGLGLNLARELARLHQGDLRLVRSDENWTEFEVRFQLARTLATASP
jgi:signal transduction histidine kinase